MPLCYALSLYLTVNKVVFFINISLLSLSVVNERAQLYCLWTSFRWHCLQRKMEWMPRLPCLPLYQKESSFLNQNKNISKVERGKEEGINVDENKTLGKLKIFKNKWMLETIIPWWLGFFAMSICWKNKGLNVAVIPWNHSPISLIFLRISQFKGFAVF